MTTLTVEETLAVPTNPASTATTMEPTLADLALGQAATVTGIRAQSALAERLLEMGLVPGTLVSLVRRGPLGDPIQVSVRGYMLSLRRSDAHAVRISG